MSFFYNRQQRQQVWKAGDRALIPRNRLDVSATWSTSKDAYAFINGWDDKMVRAAGCISGTPNPPFAIANFNVTAKKKIRETELGAYAPSSMLDKRFQTMKHCNSWYAYNDIGKRAQDCGPRMRPSDYTGFTKLYLG